jgi:hypothetical protein
MEGGRLMMSSFAQRNFYEGHEVDNMRRFWWGVDGDQVWWAAGNGGVYTPVPWVYPPPEGDLERDFEGAIETAGGVAYGNYIAQKAVAPEGVLLLCDAQTGGGPHWLLFDPSKEVTP